MRALVVDVDPTSQEFLRELLCRHEYEVLRVATGQEAWDILQTPFGPKLVVLETRLPDRDGLDIVRKVRRREGGEEVYVIVLSGQEGVEALTAAFDAGANDFVSKSAKLAELEARLGSARRFLEQNRQLHAARETIRQQATYDPLTRLENRGTVLELLRKEIVRAQRQEVPVSVILADMDHFSEVNDTYGRRSGDEVLSETARRVSNVVRLYDTPGRYGDDQFIILAPGCDLSAACQLGERVRAIIGQETFQVQGRTIAATLSIGVAAGTLDKDASEANLLDAAEAALRLAKARGHNRVESRDINHPQEDAA